MRIRPFAASGRWAFDRVWHGSLIEESVGSDESVPVWPHREAPRRGRRCATLRKHASSALDDPALYQLLALFDALRSGQARERELARKHLGKRLQ